MRRTEHHIGERRVLLHAVQPKNNLRAECEKLDLEKKAFISSSSFNQRQLLNRHSKLRQQHGKKALNFDGPRKTRSLSHGSHEDAVNKYTNNITLPGHPGTPLRSLGEKERAKSESLVSQTKLYERSEKMKSKGFSVEKQRNEIEIPSRHLYVRDIVSYSARFGRNEQSSRGNSLREQKDLDVAENQISKVASENENLSENERIWQKSARTGKNTLDGTKSPDKKEKSLENEDSYSTLNILKDFQDSSSSVFSEAIPEKRKLKANLRKTNSDDSLCEYNDADESNDLETKSILPAVQPSKLRSVLRSPFANSQSRNGLHTSIEKRLQSKGIHWREDSERPATASSSTLPRVSRTRSWVGTKDLPALGKIRQGSFCDVKTFTSGKVLDLLSSCELPTVEKKTSKQFLDVENENLKYCRYLRSATPYETIDEDETLTTPLKYRPSKNIIIGHTKVSPLHLSD